MLTKSTLTLIILLLSSIYSFSQEVNWLSTAAGNRQLIANGSENVWNVEATNEHIIVSGYITGTGASFEGLTASEEEFGYYSENYYSFLACYNRTTGKVLWVKKLPFIHPAHISVDNQNNIWLVSNDLGKGYLLKYNQQGELLINKQLNISIDVELTSITNDGTGAVIIAGRLHANRNTIMVEGNEYTDIIDNSNYMLTVFESFVMKYDQELAFQWFTITKGSNNVIINDIKSDSKNNIVLVGEFKTEPDKYLKLGDLNLTSGYRTSYSSKYASFNGFIAKISPEGNYILAKNLVGETDSWINALAVNEVDEIHVVGTYNKKASLDTQELTSKGGEDIFFTKLDAAGNVVWVKSAGGNWSTSTGDIGRGIATDANGNVFLAGSFVSKATFGEGDLTSTLATEGNGDRGGFIAQYSQKGNLVWAKQLEGIAGARSSVQTIAVYDTNAYLGGYFYRNASFMETDLPEFYPEVDHIMIASVDYSKTANSLNDLVDLSENVTVYPNPTTGRIKLDLVSYTGATGTIKILNATGSVLLNIKEISASQEIDLTPLPGGIYTLVFYNKNTIVRKKILKL